VILPDVNLLVYAVDASSPQHAPARRWWDETLSSTTAVGLCWPSLLGFLRLVTNPRVFASPMAIAEATDYVAS
jgi:predicted nucleic acid-binding protein